MIFLQGTTFCHWPDSQEPFLEIPQKFVNSTVGGIVEQHACVLADGRWVVLFLSLKKGGDARIEDILHASNLSRELGVFK